MNVSNKFLSDEELEKVTINDIYRRVWALEEHEKDFVINEEDEYNPFTSQLNRVERISLASRPLSIDVKREICGILDELEKMASIKPKIISVAENKDLTL